MEPPKKKKKEVQIIQELPDDMWNQILVRVPAKTVIELKSVCKSWRELINSNNFQISHADHWRRIRVSADTTSSQELIITQWPSCTPALVSFDSVVSEDDIPSKFHCRPLMFGQLPRQSHPSLSGPSWLVVLHCYDGLFLLHRYNGIHLLLCNPLTNSYLPLPFPPQLNYMKNRWNIVYDPSNRGYVILRSRINMVSSLRIDLNDNGRGRKIGAWRQLWSSEKLPLSFPGTTCLFFLASISINGKSHWLFDFGDNGIYTKTGILTIDAATEESIVTKCTATPTEASFFNSNGKFYCLNESSSREELQLWAIEDLDNPTWLKHHVMTKMDFNRRNFRCTNLEILKEGNRLIMHFEFEKSRDLFIYDIGLRKWQTLDILENKGSWKLKLMSIHYSLLSWN